MKTVIEWIEVQSIAKGLKAIAESGATHILIVTEDGEVGWAYSHDNWTLQGVGSLSKPPGRITHWAPFPTAPKPEEVLCAACVAGCCPNAEHAGYMR